MSVFHKMPNGEIVPLPDDIVAESNAAQQSFYNNQLARILVEGFQPPIDFKYPDGFVMPSIDPMPVAPVEE